MAEDQTLQGMKKELTQAINNSASAKDKKEREEYAKQAKSIADTMYKKLCAYQKGAKEAADIHTKN